jgi:hypothetical protein
LIDHSQTTPYAIRRRAARKRKKDKKRFWNRLRHSIEANRTADVPSYFSQTFPPMRRRKGRKVPYTGNAFLDTITDLCRQYRWDYDDLARQIGYGRRTVEDIFLGRRAYSARFIASVTRAVEVADTAELHTGLIQANIAGQDRAASAKERRRRRR